MNILLKRVIWHVLLAMGPKSKYLLRLGHLYSKGAKIENIYVCCVFYFSGSYFAPNLFGFLLQLLEFESCVLTLF